MLGAVPSSGLLYKKFGRTIQVRGESEMIKPISETVIITRKYHTTNGKKEVKTPDFYCESCEKRCGSRCTFYQRPVVADYNRCFNHSNYSPIQAVFKAKEDLEKIIEEEQERLSA